MEKLPSIIKGKYVEKGWGHELHIENNNDYCGKLLVFNKGKKFSMHYHVEKYETWFIQKGKLRFKWINPSNANIVEDVLEEGWNEKNNFISMISVKMPYVNQLNYNACIKIDDMIWC